MKNQKTYVQKLLDPRWQRKRLEILTRDEFTCQLCGNDAKTLHVHHKCYNDCEPWDIDSIHLVTLCCDCHEYEGEAIKTNLAGFCESYKQSPFLADQVGDFSWAIRCCKPLDDISIVSAAFAHALMDETLQQYMIDAYKKHQVAWRENRTPEELAEIDSWPF